MRYRWPHLLSGSALLLYICSVSILVDGITVPTGKLTPIEPPEPSTKAPVLPPHLLSQPAPVNEYTADNPEPPPLHPSYIPVKYDYIQYLKPTSVVYVPVRIKPGHYEENEIDDKRNYYQEKIYPEYDGKYSRKVPVKLLQKYQDYPTHLQKKYVYYFLKENSKS